MKLRLSVNAEPLNGYINIDPRPQNVGQNVICQDFKNISNVADIAECTELRCDNVLEYIPVDELLNVVTHWVSRLRHGGTIVLNSIDALAVAKAFMKNEINTIQFNHLLFGDSTHPWNIKSSIITLYEIAEILKRLGLVINKKRINNFEISIEAIRQ